MARRRQRIEGEIQRQVSRILLESVRDPRLSFFSVTAVRASADLRHAFVYLSVLGSAPEVERTLEVLQRARGFVRRELGAALRLRYVPQVEFRVDEELRRKSRVEEILSRLRGARDSEEQEE